MWVTSQQPIKCQNSVGKNDKLSNQCVACGEQSLKCQIIMGSNNKKCQISVGNNMSN